jgi:hypothetical protein
VGRFVRRAKRANRNDRTQGMGPKCLAHGAANVEMVGVDDELSIKRTSSMRLHRLALV